NNNALAPQARSMSLFSSSFWSSDSTSIRNTPSPQTCFCIAGLRTWLNRVRMLLLSSSSAFSAFFMASGRNGMYFPISCCLSPQSCCCVAVCRTWLNRVRMLLLSSSTAFSAFCTASGRNRMALPSSCCLSPTVSATLDRLLSVSLSCSLLLRTNVFSSSSTLARFRNTPAIASRSLASVLLTLARSPANSSYLSLTPAAALVSSPRLLSDVVTSWVSPSSALLTLPSIFTEVLILQPLPPSCLATLRSSRLSVPSSLAPSGPSWSA